MPEPTNTELNAKMNESIAVLQDAQQTVVNAKAEILAAPALAAEAKADAKTAKDAADAAQAQADKGVADADAAQAAADAAKTEAEGKVSKSGDTMTGTLRLQDKTKLEMNAHSWSIPIDILEKQGLNFDALACNSRETYNAVTLRAYNKEGSNANYAGLGVVWDSAGNYATAPAPRESAYQNDIDTLRASINRHPIKLANNTTIHVGGEGASDTADLFMGRGFSADKPFATLPAAVKWVCDHLVNSDAGVAIILQADATVAGFTISASNLPFLSIRGDTSERKLTLTAPMLVSAGCLQLLHITLASQNSSSFVDLNGNFGDTRLFINTGVTLSGTVTSAAFTSSGSGQIAIGADISGTVTGKRYRLVEGSRIFTKGRGADAIAGTCDASSVYV